MRSRFPSIYGKMLFDASRQFPGKPWIITWMIVLLGTCSLKAVEPPRLDVWLINTRQASVSGDLEKGKEQIHFSRLGENQQWIAADETSFLESDRGGVPTIFLVHGSRTDECEAIEFAWPIYCWLDRQTKEAQGAETAKPYRIVIWSWPSTQIYKHHRPDAQAKAFFCNSQSYYLARLIRNIKSEIPITVIGYSYGARISSGSLHLLGGGTFGNRRLPGIPENTCPEKRRAPLRAILVAAAVDCQELSPGQCLDCTTSQAEEILVTINRRDRVLRWYSLLYGRGGPEALGYVGPCCDELKNVRLLDVTCEVGKSHKWESYIFCSDFFDILPHYVYLAP